jgi:KDO2-lipid IV(A) lauroyltransferase
MLVLLFRLFSVLPLRALHALGAALGWLVYLASPSYRRRMRENLARAGQADKLARAIAESGKSIAELPFVWCASPDRVARHTVIENWELVQAALDAGRGIIFLTPHLGCFELTAQAVSRRQALTVMYRPPKQAALKPLVEGARARSTLHLAPANLSGVRILAKALRKGEPIGVLPDQVPQDGEGVWADFFGRSAYTMTLPAKLRQMSGADLLLVYAQRLERGRGWRVRFLPFADDLAAQLTGTPEQQARAINAAMERVIAECPEQYFWSYNRYKIPAGVVPPDTNKAKEVPPETEDRP